MLFAKYLVPRTSSLSPLSSLFPSCAFSALPPSKRPQEIPSFASLGLSPETISFLNSYSIHTPTPIQQIAIPDLIKDSNRSFYIAAQTGTGKTLSYLLPVFERLKKEEKKLEKQKGQAVLPEPHRPRAIIITPSKELALQIGQTAKDLSHFLKLRVLSISNADDSKEIKKKLEAGVDVVVINLQQLQILRKKEEIFLSKVRFFVCDEADVLNDIGYAEELSTITKTICGEKIKGRIFLVSATLTHSLEVFLKSNFNEKSGMFKRIIEKGTHMNLSNVFHEFEQVHSANKEEIFLKNLERTAKEIQKTKTTCMVFCNQVDTCRWVEYKIREANHEAISLHSKVPAKSRIQNFNRFKEGQVPFLVTSDLGSRGLDFPLVSHVINFDFPKNAADYLHRAGRTGRVMREGSAFSLYKKEDLKLIEVLKQSWENSIPISIGSSAFALKNKELLKKATGAEEERERRMKAGEDRVSERTLSKYVPEYYMEMKKRQQKSKEMALLRTKPPQDRMLKKIKEIRKEENKIPKAMRTKFSKKLQGFKRKIQSLGSKLREEKARKQSK